MKLALLIPLLTVLLFTQSKVEGAVPDLFKKKEFNSATLAKAANYYISIGEKQAITELKKLELDTLADFEQDFSSNERIGWVCRIIFTSKDANPLRPPRYGGLSLPRLTMPLKSWNLYPVAQSNGVYFVLSEGYMLAGVAERASAYIDYCSNTGALRKDKLKIPTKDEATKAFTSLKSSKRWQIIKWKDEGPGTKYTMSEEWVLESISRQASSIPK